MDGYVILEKFKEGDYEISVFAPEKEDYPALSETLDALSGFFEEYEKNNRSCEE